MEFLVDFEVDIPKGTPVSEVNDREEAESFAAADLAGEGHLLRLWKRLVASGETRIMGLYRAKSEAELDGLLGGLPLAEWMHVTVTPLEFPSQRPGRWREQPSSRRPAEAGQGPSASRSSSNPDLPP